MRVLAIAELSDDWMEAVREWQGFNERFADHEGRGASAVARRRVHAVPDADRRLAAGWTERRASSSAWRPMRSRPRARARSRPAGSIRTKPYEAALTRFVRRMLGAERIGEVPRIVCPLRAAHRAARRLEQPVPARLEGDHAGRAGFLPGHGILGPVAGRSRQSAPGGFRRARAALASLSGDARLGRSSPPTGRTVRSNSPSTRSLLALRNEHPALFSGGRLSSDRGPRSAARSRHRVCAHPGSRRHRRGGRTAFCRASRKPDTAGRRRALERGARARRFFLAARCPRARA